jgi:hypothetical protein
MHSKLLLLSTRRFSSSGGSDETQSPQNPTRMFVLSQAWTCRSMCFFLFSSGVLLVRRPISLASSPSPLQQSRLLSWRRYRTGPSIVVFLPAMLPRLFLFLLAASTSVVRAASVHSNEASGSLRAVGSPVQRDSIAPSLHPKSPSRSCSGRASPPLAHQRFKEPSAYKQKQKLKPDMSFLSRCRKRTDPKESRRHLGDSQV